MTVRKAGDVSCTCNVAGRWNGQCRRIGALPQIIIRCVLAALEWRIEREQQHEEEQEQERLQEMLIAEVLPYYTLVEPASDVPIIGGAYGLLG